MRSLAAINAYRKSSSHRSLREQEADVFRLVNATLKSVRPDQPIDLARAIGDNERLWIAVADLVRDPSNQLPLDMRASILSIGHTVRREMKSTSPDLGFLVGVNEQMAAGLAAAVGAAS